MKFLILILMILVPVASLANDCQTEESVSTAMGEKEEIVQTPKNLKGGSIVVLDARGNRYDFSSDEYMVVKRVKITHTSKTMRHVKLTCGNDKNAIMVGARRDRTDLDVRTNGTTATVESEKDLVLDVGYVRRKLVGPMGAGAGIDTNGTPKLILNMDF